MREDRASSSRWRRGRAVSPDTPLSLDVVGGDGETVSEVQEERRRESFGEHVCDLACAGNVRDPQFADCNLFPDKMNVELDVFGAPVMYWVAGHVDGRNVVAERYRRGSHRT